MSGDARRMIKSGKCEAPENVIKFKCRLASVAGAVFQAIERPEFEDDLRTGVQLVLRSGLQSICTNLWSKMAGPVGRLRPWD